MSPTTPTNFCFTDKNTERLVGYNDKDTRLLVHRFDTSGYQTSLLECNCQALYNVAHMAKSRSYSEVNRSMAMPPQQPSYVYPSVPVAATPVVSTYDWSQTGASIQGVTSGFQGLSVGQAVYPAPYYAASAGPSYTQQYYQAGPEYAINTYGLPVNVSHGTVSTECREVHISNIPHRIKKRDLVAQISKIATPTKVQLHSDHAGKFKGTAVATFGRGDEAARVVEHLDKLPFKGKELRVRIGKEQTPVNPGPLVVNGSTGYSNT